MQLGDFVTIPNQVFGEVTHLQNFETCSVEEGVFGLAFRMEFYSFPSPLKNLATVLRHPIFSLYLESTEDYPLDGTNNDMNNMEALQPDANGNVENGFKPAITAHSELVFGGVNQKHYEGCITWHDLGQFSLRDGSVFEGKPSSHWYLLTKSNKQDRVVICLLLPSRLGSLHMLLFLLMITTWC